jgi:uncharacterized membrane protein
MHDYRVAGGARAPHRAGIVLGIAAALLAAPSAVRAETLRILEALDNGRHLVTHPSQLWHDLPVPSGLSADGSLAVGHTYSIVYGPGQAPVQKWEACTWNAQGDVTALPNAPGRDSLQTLAEAVSHDGTVIVGRQESYWALRWAPGVQVITDSKQGPYRSVQAMAVSADGQIVAGSGGAHRAWLWTETGGFLDLGELPGGVNYYSSEAISYDGSVVAGQVRIDGGYEAWRWTAHQGMVSLGSLPGAAEWDYAVTGMSADGQIIIGCNTEDRDDMAFRWTPSTGMEALPNLPGDTGETWAHCISGDGHLIGGAAYGRLGTEAVLWNRGTPVNVESLLTALGYDLTWWDFDRVTAISPDGRFIAGYGNGPGGKPAGWVATIPEPLSAALLVGGLAGLLAARRRARRSSAH